jgi:hypothetical protein
LKKKGCPQSMDELDFSIKCYELHMVMRQNDMKFIHTLNKFRTMSHTQININMLNNTYLCTRPYDSKIPHLFFTNKSTCAHSDFFWIFMTLWPSFVCIPNIKCVCLNSLQYSNFHVDEHVIHEMKKLTTFANWELLV